MTDWSWFWNHGPPTRATDPFEQVLRTRNGKPLPAAQLDLMAAAIRQHLGLDGTQTVLDLCCGNGVLTCQVARHAREVIGVDYSAPLIRAARATFSAPNIEYLQADVVTLPQQVLERPIERVYMQESLQYFSADALGVLLQALAASGAAGAPLLFTGVLDGDRLANFYDTPERMAAYRRALDEGTGGIGTWWTKRQLAGIANVCGYEARFIDQAPAAYAAHYRFDMLLTPSRRD